MCSQTSAKPAVHLNQQDGPGRKRPRQEKLRLMERARIWTQVLFAELLNVLERRRYDLKG